MIGALLVGYWGARAVELVSALARRRRRRVWTSGYDAGYTDARVDGAPSRRPG